MSVDWLNCTAGLEYNVMVEGLGDVEPFTLDVEGVDAAVLHIVNVDGVAEEASNMFN